MAGGTLEVVGGGLGGRTRVPYVLVSPLQVVPIHVTDAVYVPRCLIVRVFSRHPAMSKVIQKEASPPLDSFFFELAHAYHHTNYCTSFPLHKNPEISGNPLAKDPDSKRKCTVGNIISVSNMCPSCLFGGWVGGQNPSGPPISQDQKCS